MLEKFTGAFRYGFHTDWLLCQRKSIKIFNSPLIRITTPLNLLSYPMFRFSMNLSTNLHGISSIPRRYLHPPNYASSNLMPLELSARINPLHTTPSRKKSSHSFCPFLELIRRYRTPPSSTLITKKLNNLELFKPCYQNPKHAYIHKSSINTLFKIPQTGYSTTSGVKPVTSFSNCYTETSQQTLDPANQLFTTHENETNEIWCCIVDAHLGDSRSFNSKSFFFYYALWSTLWIGISIMALANSSPFLHENLLNYQTLFSSYFLAFWGSVLCHLQSLKYGNRFSKYFGNIRYGLAILFLLSSLGSLIYYNYDYKSAIAIQLLAHISGLITNSQILAKERLIPNWLSKYQTCCTTLMLFGYLFLYLRHNSILRELNLLNKSTNYQKSS